MTSQTPRAADVVERVLAYAIAALVVLSLIAFVADIAGTASGASADNGFGQGLWPMVLIFPLLALPLGFLLVITLLVMSFVRRGREARMNRQ
ncbi:hypothetical protein [Cryobacterium tepidiphilum]|uniref:Multidrug ABC transporter ATPase n=1 Tax=Cryobacterium tepidiphilum TaxID=2486026 RepID=A0A3M8KUP9_9MICO|nr:hypothetical protein [Cryobacterium tepidiphilum]RNE56983.1 hypothetical protein EEJ31_12530 [Cryobacterium tepidiphilum]